MAQSLTATCSDVLRFPSSRSLQVIRTFPRAHFERRRLAVEYQVGLCEKVRSELTFELMARWPSGQRRCTCNAMVDGGVGHRLRGFESHLCQSFRMLVSWLRVDGFETASAWNGYLMHDRLVSSQGLDSQCHDICPVTFARDDHLQSVILIKL